MRRFAATISMAMALAALAAIAPAAQARIGLRSAQKAANAKITTLVSYGELASVGAPGLLRSGGCKRLRRGRVRCSTFRTSYRPCPIESSQQSCDPLTRIWKVTLARTKSGGLHATRIRTSDTNGFAGPCAGGPCVNGERVSGGSTVEGAARAAVLVHPSYTTIVPPDLTGARLIDQGCTGVGPGESECRLYRAAATPCDLSGGTAPGDLCVQALAFRSWTARVKQDRQDPQQFTAQVVRYSDSSQPPAR